jgi:hypothetical protein
MSTTFGLAGTSTMVTFGVVVEFSPQSQFGHLAQTAAAGASVTLHFFLSLH